MEQPYHTMDFDMLESSPFVARLGNSLLINDNLDIDHPLSEETINQFRFNPNKLVSLTNILICVEGTIDITQNLKDVHLAKNDINIANSGCFGSFLNISDDAKFIVLVINDDFYFPFVEAASAPNLKRYLYEHTYFHLSEEDMRHTLGFYQALKAMLNDPDKRVFKREIAEGIVKAMLFNFYEEMEKEAEHGEIKRGEKSRAQEIYDRFIEEVQLHYTRERDIKFYADKLCISPKYLSQVVRKVSGSFANDHIRNYVISEAKALILSRKFTISQITDFLHFNTLSFFTKYFKKATGMSPRQFQLNNREEKEETGNKDTL